MSGLQIFLILFILPHYGSPVTTKNIVLTKQGHVRGIRENIQDYNGISKTEYKFLGIPYAKSPIGNLRFRPPQPLKEQIKSSNRTYNATNYAPICWQTPHYFGSIKLAWPVFNSSTDMDEDCLYLNIYTPTTNCTRKFPVVVHIHGGSYVAGTPIRDVSPGEYLPRHDVVLVTIQYRLDAFGFFTTGDSEAPGNLGLLDQIEALKWIQNNIGAFCGDKTSVTLLGESAGGAGVSLHYLSPLSSGLFHRGIAVSGVALTPFALQPNTTVLKASQTLIKGLGCQKRNSRLTVECLRRKSGKDIIQNNTDFLNVQPFVDNHFLRDQPRKLLKEGTFHRLPLMSGFVSNEGTNGILEPNVTKLPADYENHLDKLLFQKYLHFTKEQAPTIFDALAFQYTPWHDLENPEAYKKNVIDMLSDFMVIAPTHDVLSFHSDHGAKTYMFEFAHRSRYHPGKTWKGVAHEDTTAYKFGLPLLKSPKTNLTFDDDDRSVSKKMVTLFTNFVKTGNPNTPSPVSGVQWTAFNKANKAYLKIQTNPTMTSNYHPSRMGFWNSYFPTLFPCRERKSWYGQCKRSKTARPSQPSNGESNPATSVRGGPDQKIVLW